MCQLITCDKACVAYYRNIILPQKCECNLIGVVFLNTVHEMLKEFVQNPPNVFLVF